MLEDRELLPKDQILKVKLLLSSQQRFERSCNDPQPLAHEPRLPAFAEKRL